MTGETPEVRFDKRKTREKKREKDREKREKERKEVKQRKRCRGSIIINLHTILNSQFHDDSLCSMKIHDSP